MPPAAPVSCESAPFETSELDALFAPVVADATRVALAVSGGSDSVALLVLLAEWIAGRGGAPLSVHVLTVDHGLRSASAQEAQDVAALAARLGWPHATLAWSAGKPRSGLAAAARAARYRLMEDYLRAHEIPLLLTAHTCDDQAETLLMRLARGSGVDGLSAMAALASLGDDGLLVGRPFLAVPKSRLVAALRARGLAWAEDPTNQDETYERPRLRAAAEGLAAAGLAPAAMAESARRLRRARSALEEIAHRFLRDPVNAHVHPLGFVEIPLERLSAEPEEIVLRILKSVVQGVGGTAEPVSMRALEHLVGELLGGTGPAAWTLARTAIKLRAGRVHCEREPGRAPLPEIALAPGCNVCWDGRFQIACGMHVPSSCHVAALGAPGLAAAEAGGMVRPAVSAQVLRALPAIWRESCLLAVPLLQFKAQPALQLDVAARFLGLRDQRPAVAPGPIAP